MKITKEEAQKFLEANGVVYAYNRLVHLKFKGFGTEACNIIPREHVRQLVVDVLKDNDEYIGRMHIDVLTRHGGVARRTLLDMQDREEYTYVTDTVLNSVNTDDFINPP